MVRMFALRYMVCLAGSFCLLAVNPFISDAQPSVQLSKSQKKRQIDTWIKKWVAGQGLFPGLRRVQAAAEAALGLESPDRVRVWASRARQRALLPQLDVRAGTDTDVDVRTPRQNSEFWRQTRGLGADLRLRWGLANLVFSEFELKIHREQRARAAAVRLIREKVTQLYFERLELELMLKQSEVKNLAEVLLDIARIDGQLAAMTSGLWRVQRKQP